MSGMGEVIDKELRDTEDEGGFMNDGRTDVAGVLSAALACHVERRDFMSRRSSACV